MLGGELVYDGVLAGSRNVFMRIGSGGLHLYDQAPRDEGRGAVHHIGIRSDDLRALVARLKEQGVAFRSEIREFGTMALHHVRGTRRRAAGASAPPPPAIRTHLYPLYMDAGIQIIARLCGIRSPHVAAQASTPLRPIDFYRNNYISTPAMTESLHHVHASSHQAMHQTRPSPGGSEYMLGGRVWFTTGCCARAPATSSDADRGAALQGLVHTNSSIRPKPSDALLKHWDTKSGRSTSTSACRSDELRQTGRGD